MVKLIISLALTALVALLVFKVEFFSYNNRKISLNKLLIIGASFLFFYEFPPFSLPYWKDIFIGGPSFYALIIIAICIIITALKKAKEKKAASGETDIRINTLQFDFIKMRFGVDRWRFTNTSFFEGKKEYPLDSIKSIKIGRSCRGFMFNGEIHIKMKDGGFKAIEYTLLNEKNAYQIVSFVVGRLKIKSNPEDSIFRRRCKLCGAVYCFTQNDLNRNDELRRKSLEHSIYSLGGGTITSALERREAENAREKIIDYSRCLKCGSVDIAVITLDEFNQMQSTASATPTIAEPANISDDTPTTKSDSEITTTSDAVISPDITIINTDELKKLKDLLDNGIITQEEFDAKKKQLLGL